MKIFVRWALVIFLLPLSVSCRDTGGSPGGSPERRLTNAPALMSSTADLKDKRIGVLLGSVYDRFAAKSYPQATVLQFDSPTDLRLAVQAGKVDAGLSDEQPLVENPAQQQRSCDARRASPHAPISLRPGPPHHWVRNPDFLQRLRHAHTLNRARVSQSY